MVLEVVFYSMEQSKTCIHTTNNIPAARGRHRPCGSRQMWKPFAAFAIRTSAATPTGVVEAVAQVSVESNMEYSIVVFENVSNGVRSNAKHNNSSGSTNNENPCIDRHINSTTCTSCWSLTYHRGARQRRKSQCSGDSPQSGKVYNK